MLNLVSLIKTAGYLGVAGIVFAESGLFFGFLLPGDSLLFTAGFLASQGFLNIYVLAPLIFICAVAGDSLGYAFGRRVGPKIFNRGDSLWFHQDHLLRAEKFYEKHGGKTIILARFIPIVRTFAPIVAGVGRMKYPVFVTYNIAGGFLWSFGVTGAGYFLGSAIPDIDKYLLPIILGIILVSASPMLWHLLKEKENRNKIIALIRSRLEKK